MLAKAEGKLAKDKPALLDQIADLQNKVQQLESAVGGARHKVTGMEQAVQNLRKAVPAWARREYDHERRRINAAIGAEVAALESRLTVCEGVQSIELESQEAVHHAQSLRRDHPAYPRRDGDGRMARLVIDPTAWRNYLAELRAEADTIRPKLAERQAQVAQALAEAGNLLDRYC